MTSAFDADTFGVGMNVTQIQSLNRRAFKTISAQPGGWDAYVGNIARRIWQEAAAEAVRSAMPGYWLIRAETLEAVGTESADEAARNCRRHAWLLSTMDLDEGAAEAVSLVSAEGGPGTWTGLLSNMCTAEWLMAQEFPPEDHVFPSLPMKAVK